MKYLILILFCSITLAQADEMPKELYMPNESGGFTTLTTEPCGDEYAKGLGFEYRVLATEGTGEEHVGCWNSIVIPDHLVGKVEPYVNTWWERGLTVSYRQSLFSQVKRRW